jgi:hypothetical protein
MAKHVTDRDVEKIVKLLDGWQDKLTWDALCEACLPIIGVKPVRQTLMKFSRIADAYTTCKQRLQGGVEELSVPPTMKIAAERIARLERENERLKKENAALLEQFVVWQYNAHIHGVNSQILGRDLPSVDR